MLAITVCFNPIENAFAKLKALLRKPPSEPSMVSGRGRITLRGENLPCAA
jgi:transposase